jgi:hypothetical protein
VCTPPAIVNVPDDLRPIVPFWDDIVRQPDDRREIVRRVDDRGDELRARSYLFVREFGSARELQGALAAPIRRLSGVSEPNMRASAGQ